MKHLLVIGTVLAALSSTADAAATRCRGANGKFIACAHAAPAAPARCKGANGRFVKCGTLGAHPA